MSKQGLKHSGTFFSKICMRPWIRSHVFHGLLPPEGDLVTKLYTLKTTKYIFHHKLNYSFNNLVYYSLNSSHIQSKYSHTTTLGRGVVNEVVGGHQMSMKPSKTHRKSILHIDSSRKFYVDFESDVRFASKPQNR